VLRGVRRGWYSLFSYRESGRHLVALEVGLQLHEIQRVLLRVFLVLVCRLLLPKGLETWQH
jgi:hypothetical protein